MGAETFFEQEDHEEIKALENLRNTSGTRIEEAKALKSNKMIPQTYEKSDISSTISPIKEVVWSQQRIIEESPDNHFKPSPSPVKSMMVVTERETATSPIKTRQSRRSRQN